MGLIDDIKAIEDALTANVLEVDVDGVKTKFASPEAQRRRLNELKRQAGLLPRRRRFGQIFLGRR